MIEVPRDWRTDLRRDLDESIERDPPESESEPSAVRGGAAPAQPEPWSEEHRTADEAEAAGDPAAVEAGAFADEEPPISLDEAYADVDLAGATASNVAVTAPAPASRPPLSRMRPSPPSPSTSAPAPPLPKMSNRVRKQEQAAASQLKEEKRFDNPSRPEGLDLRQRVLKLLLERPYKLGELARTMVIPHREIWEAVERLQRDGAASDLAPQVIHDRSTRTWRAEARTP